MTQIKTLFGVALLSAVLPSAAQVEGGAPVVTPNAPTHTLYIDTTTNAPVRVTGTRSTGADKCDYEVAAVPSHGKVQHALRTADKSWIYLPERSFVGHDEFQLRARSGACATRTLRVVVIVSDTPSQKTYVVDSHRGDDHNAGTVEHPFASIQAAADVTHPGDVVLIRDGTYQQTSTQAVVLISRSGAPGAFITYKPYPGEHPVLHAETAWNHVLIFASYIRVQGLEIAGNAKNVPLQDAIGVYEQFAKGKAHQTFGPETSAFQTNGISVRPFSVSDLIDKRIAPRHIEILNNYVHDCPGGGISAEWADYITVFGNRVTDNCVRTLYATSGISLLGLQNTDQEMPRYKDYIASNTVERNRTMVKWEHTKAMSDGNGIILDSNRNESPQGDSYRGRILVANNVVTESGGAGIQIFRTDHVNVYFNTVMLNNITSELDYGQLMCHAASDVRFLNNVVVAGGKVRTNRKFNDTQNVLYDYNLYFGGMSPEVIGPHDLQADPHFIDAAAANLHLSAASPARKSGQVGLDVRLDHDGVARPSKKSPSRGAFEK